MLFAPPPGYNPAAVNRQNVGPFNIPGQQGAMAQGYFGNPFRSSYSPPSSYSIPSSVNVPNQYYSGGAATSPANLIKALAGK